MKCYGYWTVIGLNSEEIDNICQKTTVTLENVSAENILGYGAV